MATVKSSAENLTLNADGSGNDIVFQSNGSNIATLDQAGLLTATTFAGSGASLTALNATNLGSGTVPTARLGSGTASSSTFLRGDSTYASAADATKLPLAGGTMTGTLVLPAGSGSTGGLNMPNVNSHITGSGHGVIQTDATMSYFYGGTDGVQFRTANNASRLVGIDNTGNVTLDSGDIVFGTAGKGICLGVTSNTDANTLADYEEGTFTPTLNDGRAITYSAQEGIYTKIGRQVFWHLKLQWTARSGSTQTYVYLAALPFTVGTSTDGYIAIAPAFWNNPAQGAYQVGCDAAQNGTAASFTYNATGTSGSSRVHCLSNQLNDTGLIKASGSYFTT